MCLMLVSQSSIVSGIESFSEMYERDSENIAALLGLATGHMLDKTQVPRSRLSPR